MLSQELPTEEKLRLYHKFHEFFILYTNTEWSDEKREYQAAYLLALDIVSVHGYRWKKSCPACKYNSTVNEFEEHSLPTCRGKSTDTARAACFFINQLEIIDLLESCGIKAKEILEAYDRSHFRDPAEIPPYIFIR